jgi:hypothetical protein
VKPSNDGTAKDPFPPPIAGRICFVKVLEVKLNIFLQLRAHIFLYLMYKVDIVLTTEYTLSIISIRGTFSSCKLFKKLDFQSVFSPADCIRWFGIIWD